MQAIYWLFSFFKSGRSSIRVNADYVLQYSIFRVYRMSIFLYVWMLGLCFLEVASLLASRKSNMMKLIKSIFTSSMTKMYIICKFRETLHTHTHIHWKMCSILINEILRAPRVTGSWVFLECPHITLNRMCTTCISFADNVSYAHTRHIERSTKNSIWKIFHPNDHMLMLAFLVVRFICMLNFCMLGR